MNDKQRAREFLAQHYESKGGYGVTAELIRSDIADGVIPTREVLQVITAALRAAPEGFVLVPVEPTEAMLLAGLRAPLHLRHVWPAMLAARPQGVKG